MMSIQGWRPVGDPVKRLCDAIEECESLWGNDPAYKQTVFWLDKVEQELDAVTASPGRRAALRAMPPSMSGQEPTDRAEPSSEAQ